MERSNDFDSLVAAANADLDDPERNRVMLGSAGDRPRFELYHAGLSICSQKVRAVLAEKNTPYLSHEMVILASGGIYSDDFKPAENYRPSFVRLRLAGGAHLTPNLAAAHTGRSSVETEGFDPCVVPVLADHETEKILVDSKVICEHIDQALPTSDPLIPDQPALAEQVERQVRIVDQTPHPGVLYGFHPDDDRRPDFIKVVMADVYDNKCHALSQLIEQNREDADLVRAYESKMAKEKAGKARARDAGTQHAVRAEFTALIEELDETLGASEGDWICGERYTLADLMWGISLYRMQWLGLGHLWDERPQVGAYASRAYKRPSVWDAVINWPSPMPPSPHTSDIH
ncbi:MAG: glutathione S-transferase [Gammaproteobacteria bacterium]|nr:glutathione S-transferase [Gammaproteobacteria bacterium]